MAPASAPGWITLIVTPLYVCVVEVAPAVWSVEAAQAPAFVASLTLARARNRAVDASALVGTAPRLTESWPPNHGAMSAV